MVPPMVKSSALDSGPRTGTEGVLELAWRYRWYIGSTTPRILPIVEALVLEEVEVVGREKAVCAARRRKTGVRRVKENMVRWRDQEVGMSTKRMMHVVVVHTLYTCALYLM